MEAGVAPARLHPLFVQATFRRRGDPPAAEAGRRRGSSSERFRCRNPAAAIQWSLRGRRKQRSRLWDCCRAAVRLRRR